MGQGGALLAPQGGRWEWNRRVNMLTADPAGWDKGLLMDGGYQEADINLHKEFVTPQVGQKYAWPSGPSLRPCLAASNPQPAHSA